MKKTTFVLMILICSFLALGNSECEPVQTTSVSKSGVKETTVNVKTNANGKTNEQENVGNRLNEDSKLGVIKHLYVISPYSGQVIIYSTIKGKVTSSGKRLTNTVELVNGDRGEWSGDFVMPKIQDDGTYGNSVPYIYWWDVQGRYHQHFFTGGQIIHISDQPIPVKNITINMELQK